jgi:hypothetical protein
MAFATIIQRRCGKKSNSLLSLNIQKNPIVYDDIKLDLFKNNNLTKLIIICDTAI